MIVMNRDKEVTVSEVLRLIAKLTEDDRARLLTTLQTGSA